jgi:hypothetical protein
MSVSDRWVFLVAFLTIVLVAASAFAIPQFFPFELLKASIYVVIAVLVFFGEDRYSYMLGILAPLLWFVLAILLGSFFSDFGLMFSALTGKPSPPTETPFHGLSLVAQIALVVLSVRAWRKQVPEKFFGKTFAICLVISLVYVGILAGWNFRMFTMGGVS